MRHEAIISLTVGSELYNHYRVEIRRESKNFTQGDNQDLYDAARPLGSKIHALNSASCIKLIAEHFAAMPRVLSVEVIIGPTRQGILFSP